MSEVNPYRMKLERFLLHFLAMNNVDPDDAVYFFTEQVEKLISVEPNLLRGRKRSKYSRQEFDTWIMRDYYPGTNIPFKITMMKTKDLNNDFSQWVKSEYYVRISMIKSKFHSFLQLEGSVLRPRYLERKFENEVFGSAHNQKPLIEEKFKKPKRMAPKGLKPSRNKKKA